MNAKEENVERGSVGLQKSHRLLVFGKRRPAPPHPRKAKISKTFTSESGNTSIRDISSLICRKNWHSFFVGLSDLLVIVTRSAGSVSVYTPSENSKH